MPLGGTTLTRPDTIPQLAMESPSPHRNDFDPGQEAQTAHCAFRWLNTPGP